MKEKQNYLGCPIKDTEEEKSEVPRLRLQAMSDDRDPQGGAMIYKLQVTVHWDGTMCSIYD